MPTPSETRERRWALSLLLLALVPRVVTAVWLGDTYHFPDEYIYRDVATRLLAGMGFKVMYAREPGYPVFLAILSMLGEPSLTTLRVVQACVVAGGAWVIYAVGRQLFSPAAGICAGVLYAFDPLTVFAGALLYPEAVAALGVLLALWAVVVADQHDRLALAMVSGALLGGVVLLRAVALVLLPLWVLWLATSPRLSWRRRLQHGLVVSVVCAAVLTPWTYRNYRVHDRLVLITLTGEKFAPETDSPLASETTQLSDPGPLPLRLVRRVLWHLPLFWELYPTHLATDQPNPRSRMHAGDQRLPMLPSIPRTLRDHVSIASFGPELLLATLGLMAALTRCRRAGALMAGVLVSYTIGYCLFVAKLRYRITILPELFLLAGMGCAVLGLAVRAVRAGLRRSSGLEPRLDRPNPLLPH